MNKIKQTQKIFVNRSLNFSHIQMVGFDMDHTLVAYHRDAFETLAFRSTVAKFVEAGYPEELMNLKFDPKFIIRGLLVDKERGNVLKADSHKYVKIAYHGHRPLSKDERHKIYNQHSFKAQNFLSVDTFFALSEVQLFVEIVDFMERYPGRISKSFAEVYNDLRYFIDKSHRDGSIKNEVIKEPEKYVKKDKHLGNTLVRLIDSGKKTFLLTNSLYDYTDQVMNFLLHEVHEDFSKWKDFFHITIVGSGKPGFFVGSQPFFEVAEDSNLLKVYDGAFEPGKIYHGGNAKLFESLTQIRGDQILYVGDHIYGDIMQSKGMLNWRTLLVIEELEEEIPKLQEAKAMLMKIHQKIAAKEELDEMLQRMRSKLANLKRQMHKSQLRSDPIKKIQNFSVEIQKIEENINASSQSASLIQEDIVASIRERSGLFHPIWGEIMKVGLERSRFADQIDSYACLYTSKVSNLRLHGPQKKFISYHEALPHEV